MVITELLGLDLQGLKNSLRNYIVENISSSVMTDPADSAAGNALLDLIAYPVATAIYHIDWQINESNLETCTLRSSAERLARNNGYTADSADAAEVDVLFEGTSQFTIPRGFKVNASSSTNEPLVFSTTEAGTAAYDAGSGSWKLTLNCINAEYKTESGITQGVEDFEITLTHEGVIIDSEFLNGGVVVNGLTYIGIANRLEAGPNDRRFIYYHNKDGQLVIRFGDNEFGLRVPDGVVWTVNYKVGGGLSGNVAVGAINALQDSAAGLSSCYNLLPSTGGADEETITQIKVNAINNIKTRQAALTQDDYEDIALEVNGIAKAHAEKDIQNSTPPVINLYLASEGSSFGVPTSSKRSEVLEYFDDKQCLGTTLNVLPATSQNCKVKVEVSLQSGTNQAVAEATIRENILALLDYPNTDFNTTLLHADIQSAANVSGTEGANIKKCYIISQIVEDSDNVTDATWGDVFIRTNSEKALNVITATGNTTFTVTKKLPHQASVLAVDSVKDTTQNWIQLEGESSSIQTKAIDGVNTLTDNTISVNTNEYQNYLLVDSNQNIFTIVSNTPQTFTLSDNALNQGAGDYDVVSGDYKIVRSFVNRNIEKAGSTRTITYNTENQFFIDNISEGDLTVIMARDDVFYIDVPNGSGSVGTLFESTDADYSFLFTAGSIPFRSIPPADNWTMITSEYNSDITFKRDSDILTFDEESDIEVTSFFRSERRG